MAAEALQGVPELEPMDHQPEHVQADLGPMLGTRQRQMLNRLLSSKW